MMNEQSSKLVFEEDFKIRASEVGLDRKATLPAICNLLQEIAGNHARQLDFDITDLQQNKLTWVLHRLQVDMVRFPDWRENITLRTWPSGGDGLRAHRDYLILDADDEVLGRSLSYWLILDMESRRPVRIPGEIMESVPPDSDHVLGVTDGSFSTIRQPDTSHTYMVRKTDLDLNRHVNNVKYIEWALAGTDNEEPVDNIDIKFMAEATFGDTVVAEQQNDGDVRHYQLRRSSDDKILALANSGLAD